MGTNYYLWKDWSCLHIGKSSSGWCFALHVIPEKGINDLGDWKKLWENEEETVITDDCGTEFGKTFLEREIAERGILPGPSHESDRWFAENSAENGPNGLVRHRIDGKYCTGHGEGTWDLMIGDFS